MDTTVPDDEPVQMRLKLLRSSSLITFIRDGSWLVAGSGFSRVLNLAAVILIARVLGPSRFGQYSLVQISIFYATMLFGSAVPAALTKFLSSGARDENDKIRGLAGFIYVFLLTVLIILVLILIAIFVTMRSRLIFGPVLLVLGIVLCLGTLARELQDATFSGFQEFSLTARTRIAEGVVFISTGPVLAYEFGAQGAIAASAMAALLALTLGTFLTKSTVRTSFAHPDFATILETARIFLSFSLPTTVAIFVPAAALLFTVYRLGVSDPSLVQTALYNASYQWLGPITFVPMALAAVGFPMLSKAWASRQQRDFFIIYLRLVAGALAIAICVGGLLVCVRPYLAIAYGPKFGRLSELFLWIALAAPGKVITDISQIALQASDRFKALLVMTCAWTAIFLLIIAQELEAMRAVTVLKALGLSYFIVGLFAFSFISMISRPALRTT